MVDHKVCHLEQSFVAPKICVRIEVTVCTQFARASLTPSANGTDYSAMVYLVNRLFFFCSDFRKKRWARALSAMICGIQVFRTELVNAVLKQRRKPGCLGGMLHERELTR